MLDETIIGETPPLYRCYGRIGEQVRVLITGNHARRILHGVINIGSGDVLLLITQEWVRAHGRGWHIVLFEDRGSPHTAKESLAVAQSLNIEIRFLPTATPELNAMDQLWRRVEGSALARLC